jgi:hypothetical protein
LRAISYYSYRLRQKANDIKKEVEISEEQIIGKVLL